MAYNYKFVTPVILKKEFVLKIQKLDEKDTISLQKNNLIYTTEKDLVSRKGLKNIDSLNEHLNKELKYNLKYNGYTKTSEFSNEMNM